MEHKIIEPNNLTLGKQIVRVFTYDYLNDELAACVTKEALAISKLFI